MTKTLNGRHTLPESVNERRASDDVPILSGEKIVDVALAIGCVGPMHYREWFNKLFRAGYAIAGKDPHAVVLVNLSRHPLVERVGDGIYQRDDLAVQKLRASVVAWRRKVIDLMDQPMERDQAIVQLQRAERIAGRYEVTTPDQIKHIWGNRSWVS